MSADCGARWRWIETSVVLAIHDCQLAEHGGADGIRNSGAIASALGHPAHLASHGSPDMADLAAAYIYGLASNHGFIDGNKRTAWVTGRVFLADNGRRLNFAPLDAVHVMEGVAAGRVDEAGLASWLRSRMLD